MCVNLEPFCSRIIAASGTHILMCNRSPFWLVAPILIFAQFACAQSAGATSSTPQAAPVAAMEFLFDDAWIDHKEGVERVLASPVKQPEPILAPVEPWEALGVDWATVIHDADERKFKMWYRATCAANDG